MNTNTVLLAAATLAAASTCVEPIPEAPEPQSPPPWKDDKFRGGKARHVRGGVTRKSRFDIPTKVLRKQKKAERQRRRK